MSEARGTRERRYRDRWSVGREDHQAFVEALRAYLGLEPLYSNADRPEVERFYAGEYPSAPDGMVRRHAVT